MRKFEICNSKFEMKSKCLILKNLNSLTNFNLNFKLKIKNSWRSQTGVSSMMVLILAVLIIIVGWELGQFVQRFSDSGREIPPTATGNQCFGSNTAFDCYDQDEGTDFEDTSAP